MKTKRSRVAPALLALVMTVALTSLAAARDATIESRLGETTAMFQKARDDNWDLYAPKTFAEARKSLDKAQEKYRKGGEIDEIREEIDRAGTRLAEAGRYVEIGAIVLTSAIEARADALATGAPAHASDEWKDAKESLHEAGRSVEKGDSNDARRKATEAESRFRAAEMKAIRVDLLGAARRARDEAREADADEKAPRTYAEGHHALESAESTLQGDRYQRAEAKDQARAATDAFRHATYIAGLVDRVDADDPAQFEDQQRQHEAVLAEVAKALNMRVDFTGGIADAGAAVLAGVQSLKADRDNLREELGETATLADSLSLALEHVEEKQESVSAAMRIEQKRQQDLRELQDLFPADQASVVRQGDEVICRIYGLSFPVGSSEIQPRNFEILTRIQRALRIFPDADVVVEGHTDAAGDDDLNRQLSQERADAVRQYIVANMPNAAARITTKGYGESSPLASNDSPEGRAKNRRIEIRLTDLYGDAGAARPGAVESASASP